MTATFYHDASRRPCSNGRTYLENRAAYGFFCASNRYGLGSRLLVSCGGRRVRVVVADRVGHGTDVDLDTQAFRHLAGRHWREVGRLTVQVRRLKKGRG